MFTTAFAIFQFADNFSNLKLYEYPKKILLINDNNKIKTEIGNLLTTTFILTIPVTIISIGIVYFLYFESLFNEKFLYVIIYLVLSLAISPAINILRAFILFSKKLDEYISYEININLIFRTLLILILYFYVNNLVGALIINFATRLILLPGLILFLKKSQLFPRFHGYGKTNLITHFNFASRVMIAESFSQLIYSLIAYILLMKYDLRVVSTVLVAVSIIQRVPQIIYTYLLIYNQKLTDKISKPREVFKLVMNNVKFTFYIYFSIFLVSIIFEDLIIDLVKIFGEVDLTFVKVFLIFVLLEALLFISRLEMFIMQMISLEKIILKNSLITLLFSVLFFLIIYSVNSTLLIDILSFLVFYLSLILLNHLFLKNTYFNKNEFII